MESGNGYVNVNGVAVGQSSLIIQINNKIIYGYTDINYKGVQDKESLYASGDTPWKVGYGNITYTGSITLYANEIDGLRKAVRLLGYSNGALWNAPTFTIDVIKKPFAGQELPLVDTLRAEFKEDGMTVSQGEKGLKMELELLITSMKLSTPF